MRGGRMIFNPVRYGSGGTKTVEVTITLTAASYIELYCTQNGKFLNYYHGSSNEASEFTVTVDAGSCFVVRIGESYIDFSTLINCRTMVVYNLNDRSRIGVLKAADA